MRPPLNRMFASLFRADFTVLLRSGRTMILNIAVPILILIVTDLNHSKTAPKVGFGSVNFEIGLALTYGLMASSLIGYSITVARDREAGVFQRLRVSPAPTWAIMTSRLLVQLVLDLLMTIVVVAIGVVLHHIDYTVTDLLLIGCISLLGGITFLAIGQAIVGLVRSATVVNAIGRVLYAILLLIGLLGSSGLLGTTVQIIAEWSPVGALITLFDGVVTLVSWGGAQNAALLACIGYIVIGTFVGIRWFRWESR
jgi:ABC-2 type transport system permease protein